MFAEGARMLLGCPSLGSGARTAHFSLPRGALWRFPLGKLQREGSRGQKSTGTSTREPPKGAEINRGSLRARHFPVSALGGLFRAPCRRAQPKGSEPHGWNTQPSRLHRPKVWLALPDKMSLRQNVCVFQTTQRLFLLLRCRVGTWRTHRAFLVPPFPSTQPRESFCFPESLLA